MSKMLTPQDILEKRFVKAVFGGYDMAGVDEFLEDVSTDYNALYKENAILKGKLKVLVEKVEEYRSTEDAMRMALLTAQRMGEEITVEAARTKEEMLKSADDEVKARLAEISKKIAHEEARLTAASKETTKFLELSQAILRKHSEFLKKLESANQAIKSTRTAEKAAPEAIAEPQVVPVQAAPATELPPAMPTPAPVPAAAAPAEQQEFEMDSIAAQIGNAVEKMTVAGAEPPPPLPPEPDIPPAAPPASLFDEQGDTNELPVAEAATTDVTPRPRFDFDDLKFGANFDGDE